MLNLDGWDKDIIVSREEIEAATATLSQRTHDDIESSHTRVKGFAAARLVVRVILKLNCPPACLPDNG